MRGLIPCVKPTKVGGVRVFMRRPGGGGVCILTLYGLLCRQTKRGAAIMGHMGKKLNGVE